MFLRATSACFLSASSVTSRPRAGKARASQIVLYPPSVPISRIFRAPCIFASRYSSFPWLADTAISGRPAFALSAKAAFSAASAGISSPSR